MFYSRYLMLGQSFNLAIWHFQMVQKILLTMFEFERNLDMKTETDEHYLLLSRQFNLP